MNDLNAPLGQSGRKSSDKSKSGRAKFNAERPRRGLVRPLAIIAFASIVGLNAYSVSMRDRLPASAPIELASAVAVEDATVTGSVSLPESGDGNNSGVEVVYGTSSSTDDTELAVPEPRPDISEGRISEGGPKVIVIRDPSAADVGQPVQVAHLPDTDAVETSDQGPLPVRTDDGRRPMDIYARPWSHAGGKRIAIVIGGLGLSQTGTQRALKTLPPEITLAFAPQGNSLNRWMQAARKNGHELLIQVPMEPFGYPQTDPGPQTLTVASSEEANLENLHWALGQMTNYTGIVNYLGGRFVTDEQAITPVLRDIGQRGLLFLNDGTAGDARLASLARAYDVPYVAGQVVLDTSQDAAAITARLKELEKFASANGYAIGTGSALELTVDTVAAWANSAKKRGFEIVGISALAR
jgi:uncharacterized protein